MIEKLNGHLNVLRLTSDDDQSLIFRSACRTSHARRRCTWFHNLDLTRAHMPNLVNFASALSNYTPNQVVGDVNLLGLKLLRRIVHSRCSSTTHHGSKWRCTVARHIRLLASAGAHGWPRSTVRRTICRVCRGRHAFLAFNEDVSHIVCGDMDGIGDPGHAQHALRIETMKESAIIALNSKSKAVPQ